MRVPLAAAVLLIAPAAQAEINMAESVEWLTISRPHVAIVEPVAAADERLEGRVVRALKGEPPRDFTTTRSWWSATWKPGGEFLAFFDEKGTVDAIFDLGEPKKDGRALIAADFTVLDTRREILAAVDARLGDAEKTARRVQNIFVPEKGFVRLEVPHESEAWTALYGGSACYLIVPADPAVKARLVAQLRHESAWERAEAAARLRAFPGPETEAMLRALLADPASEIVTSSDGATETKVTVHPVRQAAWLALDALGVKVEKPRGWQDGFDTLFD